RPAAPVVFHDILPAFHGQPQPEVSRPVRPQPAAAARGSPRDVAIGIYASEIDCPAVRIRPWDRGAFRSRRTGLVAQALTLGGSIVQPWLPAKRAGVSNLPACCALGPPACAAPCCCHHEACSGRSAWPHPGKACPSV